MTQMQDVFSMSSRDVEQARQLLSSMVQDLSDKVKGVKSQTSQSTPGGPQPTAAGAQAGPSAPLSSANLQQQQQQLKNQVHQRSASRGTGTGTPVAPTSSQPPMPPWGASSPHGTPVYNQGKPPVTQENLHIPARKKQKANPASGGFGAPASNASPLVNKIVSPELKRQHMAESKPLPKPSMCCPETTCDRHKFGFDSQEALDVHTRKEHVELTADPLKYALESLAASSGLDSEGRPKVSGGEKMAASDSRQDGQTPNIKAGTPMSRQGSMVRQASTAGSKPNTKSEAEKQSAANPWATSTLDPQELTTAFGPFGGISDTSLYRAITPNESPESDQTAVTETSDISDGANLDIHVDLSFDDSWRPFAASDIEGMIGINDYAFSDEFGMMPPFGDKSANLQAWDDMPKDFNRPFDMDTNLFSMTVDSNLDFDL